MALSTFPTKPLFVKKNPQTWGRKHVTVFTICGEHVAGKKRIPKHGDENSAQKSFTSLITSMM